jgi:hypothetical protein
MPPRISVSVSDYMAYAFNAPWVKELGDAKHVDLFSAFILDSRTPEVKLGKLAVCVVSAGA